MNITRWLALLLIVTVLAVVVQPARAEALEPNTILLIAGVAVAIVLVIVVVVIANVRESQRGANLDRPIPVAQVDENPDSPVLIAQVVPLQSQTP